MSNAVNFNQKNKSDKLFIIKVEYDNGYAIKEFYASTFGLACQRIEKQELKMFRVVKSFTNITNEKEI